MTFGFRNHSGRDEIGAPLLPLMNVVNTGPGQTVSAPVLLAVPVDLSKYTAFDPLSRYVINGSNVNFTNGYASLQGQINGVWQDLVIIGFAGGIFNDSYFAFPFLSGRLDAFRALAAQSNPDPAGTLSVSMAAGFRLPFLPRRNLITAS